MLWVLSMRTMLSASGASEALDARLHRNSYAALTFSNMSLPFGFLSGWYCCAILKYAFLILVSSGSCTFPSPSSVMASFAVMLVGFFSTSFFHSCSTSRSKLSGVITGQSENFAVSQRFLK